MRRRTAMKEAEEKRDTERERERERERKISGIHIQRCSAEQRAKQ